MGTEIKFTDNSDKIIAELKNDAIPRALTRIGMQAEGYAKDLAPVLTGFLHNSITFAISGESPNTKSYRANTANEQGKTQEGSYSGTMGNKDEAVVYIGSNVPYARRKELGYGKEKPKPYLKPAVSDHKETYKNIIKDEMKSG